MFTFETWILYIMALTIFCAYLFRKYAVRRYIISAYNINTIIYAFDLLFMPFVFWHSRAWRYSLDYVREPFNKCLQFNLVGFAIVMLCLSHFEFRRKNSGRLVSQVKRMSGQLNDTLLHFAWWLIVILWYAIVIVFNHGLPLFNEGRGFFYRQSYSPIYQGLDELLLSYGLYYGLRYVYYRKSLFYLIVTVMTLLFTGNRGPVVVSVLAPLIIFHLYHLPQTEKNEKMIQKGVGHILSKKTLFGFSKLLQVTFLFLILLAVGLALSAIRAGKETSIEQIIQELFYGNTFSDIRDGTMILIRFDKKFYNTFLWGKTYLAGLISFIPSYLSEFRSTWSSGRFTAYTLFGYETHFGIRGGNSMEAYLNFGLPGVAITSVIEGYYQAAKERIFYEHFILRPSDVSAKEPFVICFLPGILAFFAKSQNLTSIYPEILFFLFVTFYSTILRKRNITRRIR